MIGQRSIVGPDHGDETERAILMMLKSCNRTVLTPRERETAALVARGYTNRQIADELVISTRTAEAHVRNIRDKLGFANRSRVAAWAVSQGLVSPTGS